MRREHVLSLVLSLCKIIGFHGGDYEECRLRGFDAVVTSQKTAFFIALSFPQMLRTHLQWLLWYVTGLSRHHVRSSIYVLRFYGRVC
jgi:hypothetical protein